MSDATYIQWNFPNWITITLMVALGYMAFGLIANFVAKQKAG